VQRIRRILGWGLGLMGAVAVAAAIWPALAGVVTVLLVTVLCAGAATLVALCGRRVHTTRTRRRERCASPALDASTLGDGTAPAPAGLRESA
jgi:Flp pilus assembly protein protease CpaA